MAGSRRSFFPRSKVEPATDTFVTSQTKQTSFSYIYIPLQSETRKNISIIKGSEQLMKLEDLYLWI